MFGLPSAADIVKMAFEKGGAFEGYGEYINQLENQPEEPDEPQPETDNSVKDKVNKTKAKIKESKDKALEEAKAKAKEALAQFKEKLLAMVQEKLAMIIAVITGIMDSIAKLQAAMVQLPVIVTPAPDPMAPMSSSKTVLNGINKAWDIQGKITELKGTVGEVEDSLRGIFIPDSYISTALAPINAALDTAEAGATLGGLVPSPPFGGSVPKPELPDPKKAKITITVNNQPSAGTIVLLGTSYPVGSTGKYELELPEEGTKYEVKVQVTGYPAKTLNVAGGNEYKANF